MSDALGGLNVGAPPAGGSSSSTPTPIGVPKTYRAGAPETLTERQFVPAAGPFIPGKPETYPMQEQTRYLSGFEFTPTSWSVEDKVRLQEALDASGLYDPNASYTRGFWDDESSGAFKRLLGYANQMGKGWEESIVELGTANQADAGRAKSRAASARQPTYTEVSNPDDLKLVFDRTARSSLGRKLNEGELDSMVKAFSGIEMAEAQKRIATAAGTSNMISQGAPDPGAFAERQMQGQQGLAQEGYAHRFAQKFNVFQNMLGGLG